MTSTNMFIALLAAVGVGRLLEMRLSRRHQRALMARGFARQAEPGFPLMVAVHTGVLVGAALEVLLWPRVVPAPLATVALVTFALANALRWWVIRSMAEHWNVQIVNALSMGVVTRGPFRWVRHPNYVAVFFELMALPLIHAAYVTAIVGTAAHVFILARRIGLEDRVLLADAGYRALMSAKPRFIPWPSSSRRVPALVTDRANLSTDRDHSL